MWRWQEFVPELRIKGIGFRYPQSELEVLKDLSLRVKPGKKVVVLGKSGCGKSTFASILARQYQMDIGVAKVGNKLLNDVMLHQVRATP